MLAYGIYTRVVFVSEIEFSRVKTKVHSSDWLELICVSKFTTTFWGVFLSMYIIKRTSQRCTRRRKHFRGPENKEHQPRRGKRRTKRREQFSLRWCSKSGNPNDDYIWWSAALLLKEDGCDWVQPRTWTSKSGKLHKLTARAIDCRQSVFFSKSV